MGVEVLGGVLVFKPHIVPFVVIKANRLRRAMERYYSGDGIGDPVVIELPRGSYVPAFSRRRVPAAAPVAAVPAAAFRGLSRPLPLPGVGLAGGLLGAALGVYAGKSCGP